MSEPAAPPRPSRARWQGGLLGLALSTFFLWLALRNADAASVLAALKKADLPWLALTIPVKGLGFLIVSTRQQLLFAPVRRAPLTSFVTAALIGFAGNNLLPLRLGELMRIRYLGRRLDQPYSTCVAVVALERLTDLAVLLGATAFLLPVLTVKLRGAGGLPWYYAGVAALMVAAVMLLRHREAAGRMAGKAVGLVSRRFEKTAEAMVRSFSAGFASLASSKALLGVLLLTAGSWATMCVNVWLTMQALSLSLPWFASLAVIVFVAFGTALPSSPAFVGSYHWFASSALVLLFSVDPTTALSFAIVLHAAATLPFTAVALPVTLREVVRAFRERDPPVTSA